MIEISMATKQALSLGEGGGKQQFAVDKAA